MLSHVYRKYQLIHSLIQHLLHLSRVNPSHVSTDFIVAIGLSASWYLDTGGFIASYRVLKMSSSVLTQGIRPRLKKSIVCISDVETILEKWVFQAGDRRISKLLEHYKVSWSWKIMPTPKELAAPLPTSLVEAFVESTPNLNPCLVTTAHSRRVVKS